MKNLVAAFRLEVSNNATHTIKPQIKNAIEKNANKCKRQKSEC